MEKRVLRLETHVIRKHHRLFEYCDDICFKSKSLYNRVNFIIREEFFKSGNIIFSNELNRLLKTEECFMALPAKASQQIVIQVGKSWKSYFVSIKDWSKNKSKYTGMPKLPKYKDKNGRNVVFFDYMQGTFYEDKYYFPNRKGDESENYIDTRVTKENFVLMRIVPYGNCYKIEMIYEKWIEDKEDYNDLYLGIDLGINNLATLTNNIGLRPIVINGRPLKSINKYYNKLRAEALSYIGRGTSNRLKKLDAKRNNIFHTHLHRISRGIINYCLNNYIENIVIGLNKDWQRNANMGKKTNQVFVQIPFEKLIHNIMYKAEDAGIRVELVEQQYTSKSSFLDQDFIPEKFGDYEFSGKRIKRGLYRSSDGTLINADVNGSYNILRKCNPEIQWYNGIKGESLHPFRATL